MVATSTMARSPIHAASTPIQQIYITHCLYDEGVSREAGFGVRATSTQDPLLLRFALEYPHYALPAGLLADQVTTDQAPRRLALVRIPGGKSALVHSVTLPLDRRGRSNNFFSHVLVHPALTPADALATWASPEWMMAIDVDASKELAPWDRLPEGGTLNDQTLTAFLQGAASTENGELAAGTFPTRLTRDAQYRKQLLRLAVRGCLLALQSGPGSPRSRFYILAEPGLTALLLYAVARLLPEALAGQMTFSTYENAQRDLRTYRHAQIIGTYLADPGRGLEEEFFTTRGYALDTFSGKASPEVKEQSPLPIGEWIELAARGDWKAIDAVYGMVGKSTTSVVSFREGLEGARFSQRLLTGQVEPTELIALKQTTWGPPLLTRHRERIWPLVRDGSLTHPELMEEFADQLREHVPELEQRAIMALRSESVAVWQPHWRLLWKVLQDDLSRLRDSLQRVLPEPPFSPALRLGLLQELSELRVSPLDPRLPLQGLLKACSAEDLRQLAATSLPREWVIWAVFYALLKPETRAEVVRLVQEADRELLRAFWAQLNTIREPAQRRAILTPLFPPYDPRSAAFLGRVLEAHCSMRGETLEWLLEWLGALGPGWADFWERENHLAHLLDLVRELGDEGTKLWDRLCSQVNQDMLLPGAPWRMLMELVAAQERPGPAFPPRIAELISDWVFLRLHFEKASPVADDSQERVLAICQKRGINSVELLGRYFSRFVERRGLQLEVLRDFAGFFNTFFPQAREYPDYAARFIAWLQVVEVCSSDEERAGYQRFYLEQMVPGEHRRRLAEDCRRRGKLLPSVDLPPPASEQVVEQYPGEAQLEDGGHPDLLPAQDDEALAPAGPESSDLFPLAGLPAQGVVTSSAMVLMARRLAGLIGAVVAGLLAAGLCWFYRPLFQWTGKTTPLPPPMAGVVLFIPAVLFLASSMSWQALLVGLQRQRDPERGPSLVGALGMELLTGLVLGMLCGALLAGGALALGLATKLALALGGAVAAGMAAAGVLTLGLHSLFHKLGLAQHVPTGPVARIIAATFALWLYFGLASLLAR